LVAGGRKNAGKMPALPVESGSIEESFIAQKETRDGAEYLSVRAERWW
jgi:hypothetical protein